MTEVSEEGAAKEWGSGCLSEPSYSFLCAGLFKRLPVTTFLEVVVGIVELCRVKGRALAGTHYRSYVSESVLGLACVFAELLLGCQ